MYVSFYWLCRCLDDLQYRGYHGDNQSSFYSLIKRCTQSNLLMCWGSVNDCSAILPSKTNIFDVNICRGFFSCSHIGTSALMKIYFWRLRGKISGMNINISARRVAGNVQRTEQSLKYQIISLRPNQSHAHRTPNCFPATVAAPNMTNAVAGTHVFQAASALRVSPEMLTDNSSEQKLHLCWLHSYSPAPASPTTWTGGTFQNDDDVSSIPRRSPDPSTGSSGPWRHSKIWKAK